MSKVSQFHFFPDQIDDGIGVQRNEIKNDGKKDLSVLPLQCKHTAQIRVSKRQHTGPVPIGGGGRVDSRR